MNDKIQFREDEVYILGRKFVPLINGEKIRRRIVELSKCIENDYRDKIPLFLIVLRGAIFFGVELIKNISIPVNLETIRAKSYGQEMQSSGKVDFELPNCNFEGKDIIVIEDIIDTGLTINEIITALRRKNPNSIEIACLLLKPESLKTDVNVKYLGFEIPSKFVVGYGLDFAEFGRNLQDIFVLSEE
ncbi:MAG: hypoxanthine phosphoribosyltransferase [Ignavibacteria bacterium]|nr:hypoxanthine phosphoribosyltransferase [Ignavibacteria bacterium]